MRVLIVEDEPDFATRLKKIFKDSGYIGDAVSTVSEAKAALFTQSYDLLVLDRMLPDGDGTEVIRYLSKREKKRPPILFLTALADVPNRVDGLDAGADDYLAKPVNEMELLARVRALIRRPALKETIVLEFANVKFNCRYKEASVDNDIIKLSRVEIRILEALMLRADRFVLREHLEQSVYGFAEDIESNTLESQISRLRKKLSKANANVKITVARGVGYRITSL